MLRFFDCAPRTFARILALVALSAVVSCGGGGSTGPSLPSVDGDWHLTALVRNNGPVSCFIDGALTISQSGDHFTGQVSGSTRYCLTTTPGDSTDEGDVDGSITGGTITHNVTLSFSEGGCFFKDGLIVDAQPVNGGAICNLSYQGQSYPFDGTFQLSR